MAQLIGALNEPAQAGSLKRLELLARLETHGFTRRNRNLRTGAGIAADPGLPRPDVKNAETPQLDPLSLLKRPLHAFEDGFDGHLGFRLGDARLANDFVDDVEFDQVDLPRARTLQAAPLQALAGRKLNDMIRVKRLSRPTGMPHAPVDKDALRRACSKFATGIAVATVVGTDRAPHGLTVNSFASVSLVPPLVLFCVDHASAILPHFRANTYFGINILRQTQKDVSVHFSRKGHDRFNGVEWSAGRTGVPLLPGALALLECKVSQTVEAGDHTILIGKVVHAEWHDGKPLLYFNSGYHRIGS